MTDTKQREIWKTCPEFSFIEVSSLGKVRTKDRTIIDKNGRKRFVKGRVLKQYINPYRGGYLYLSFHVNGKTIHRYVHQLVAITFIPNPNNYPQVNHKDNDPTNNEVSNLEWCSPQYNNDYKNNFGTSPVDVSGHPVFAVDLKTGKILRFESQNEAARQLGISLRVIWNVIKGKTNTAHSWWFTEDKSEITDEKIRKIRSNMRFHGSVIAINRSSLNVLYFKSQSEAASQLNVNISSICAVIHGRLNVAGGFLFYKSDSTAVEKIRSKFGDKIADKVEKLILEII